MAAPNTSKKVVTRLHAAVFVDIDSIVRGAREMFGVQDAYAFDPLKLASLVLKEVGATCAFIYIYASIPATSPDPRFESTYTRHTSVRAMQDRVQARLADLDVQNVRFRAIPERLTSRLSCPTDTSVGPAVRIIDSSDVQLHTAIDAMNEMYSEATTAMIFMTRDAALTSLIQRLRETAAEERVFKRYYSAALWDADTDRARPSLLRGSDWLFIDRAAFASCAIERPA